MSNAAKRAEDIAFLADVTQFSVRMVDYFHPEFSWDAEVQDATLKVHTMGMQWEVLDEEEIPVREIFCWLKRAIETFCDDEFVNVWEGLYFIVKKFVVDPKTGLASVCVYDVPDQQFKIYFFR